MDTHDTGRDPAANPPATTATGPLGAVVTLSELCAELHVTTQTLYDLRSQGRGPRGFRVGRELRFRAGEIEAWLAGLEDEDARRHQTAADREPGEW